MTPYKGPEQHSVYELESIVEEYRKRIKLAQVFLKYIQVYLLVNKGDMHFMDEPLLDDISMFKDELFEKDIESNLDKACKELSRIRKGELY